MIADNSLASWQLLIAEAALNVQTSYYGLAVDRSVIGYHRKPPNIQTLMVDGPFLAVRPSGRPELDIFQKRTTFEIPVDLWLGVSRPDGDQLLEATQFVEDICAEWELLGFVVPTFPPPEIFDEQQPVLIHWVITVKVTAPHCPGDLVSTGSGSE